MAGNYLTMRGRGDSVIPPATSPLIPKSIPATRRASMGSIQVLNHMIREAEPVTVRRR